MSNEQRVKSYASLKTILKDVILHKIVNSHEITISQLHNFTILQNHNFYSYNNY